MSPNDLKRLTFFAEVVREGSFAGAARALSLPRSSISEHVRLLEGSLGIRLLQRTTRKLSLTPEGHEIYARAISIQALVKEIDELTSEQSAAGSINVSATQDIAERWLIPKLTEFNRAYPDIQVNLLADDFLSDLVGQRIDVALRVTVRGTESNLIGRTLGQESLRLYASPIYLQRREQPQTPDALEDWNWILLQQTSIDGKLHLLWKGQQFVVNPPNCQTTNAPTLQRRLIEQGYGVGLHMPSLVSDQLRDGVLHEVMDGLTSTSFDIQLVYPSRKLPLRTRAFVEFLVDIGWP